MTALVTPAEPSAPRVHFRVARSRAANALTYRVRRSSASQSAMRRPIRGYVEIWGESGVHRIDAEELEILRDSSTMARLAQADEDVAAGRTVSLDDIRRTLAARRNA